MRPTFPCLPAVTKFRFPVKNGYVTVAKMGSEIHGICLGTVLAGGTMYRVFFNLTAPQRDPGQRRRR